MHPSIIHTAENVFIKLKVNPGAHFDGLFQDSNRNLKLNVMNKPQDNKANKKVIKYFSRVLEIPKNRIAISHGLKSREKTLRLESKTMPEKEANARIQYFMDFLHK
jgi:hypothetical protein